MPFQLKQLELCLYSWFSFLLVMWTHFFVSPGSWILLHFPFMDDPGCEVC